MPSDRVLPQMPANYGGSITDFRRLSGAPIAMVSRVNEIDELIRKKKEEEKKKNSPAADDILVVESEDEIICEEEEHEKKIEKAKKEADFEMATYQQLLKQQQQTLQQQQLLTQQHYQEQKEFFAEQKEFLKHQTMTLGNIDKLLLLLANNFSQFGNLTGSPLEPGFEVKTEGVKKEEKPDEEDGMNDDDDEEDDEVEFVPIIKEEMVEDEPDEAAEQRVTEEYKRMEHVDPETGEMTLPTAEAKRMQEEIWKLMNG